MSISRIDPNKYWAESIAEEDLQKISLDIPVSMLDKIDEAVFFEKKRSTTGSGKRISRSSYIRDAIEAKLAQDLPQED